MAFFVQYPTSGGGGVSSLNGLTGALTLVAGSGITITPGAGTLTIAATGSGANTFLSNLTFPTAINTALLPDGDVQRNIGSNSLRWDEIYAVSLISTTTTAATVVNVGAAIPESGVSYNAEVDNAGGEGAYIFLKNSSSSTLNSKAGIVFATESGSTFTGNREAEISAINVNAGTGATDLIFNTWDGASAAERFRVSGSGISVPGVAVISGLTYPGADGANGDVLTTDGAGNLTFAPASGGANTALSNLASTAVNDHIIPDADNAYDLGSGSLEWRTVYARAIESDGGALQLLSAGAIQLVQGNSSFVEVGGGVAPFGLMIRGDGSDSGELRFNTASNSFYVALQAPTLSASYTLTLPTADGTSGDVLTTNGSGVLSFTTPSSGANVNLSNLVATAVNSEIRPATTNTINLGADTQQWQNTFSRTFTSGTTAGQQVILTGNSISAPSGVSGASLYKPFQGGGSGSRFAIFTGSNTDNANTSGPLYIDTGNNAGSGGSGGINLRSGANTGGGLRGEISLDADRINANFGVLRTFNSAADPTTVTAAAGDIYFNTTLNKLKVYNGTAWETITSV